MVVQYIYFILINITQQNNKQGNNGDVTWQKIDEYILN